MTVEPFGMAQLSFSEISAIGARQEAKAGLLRHNRRGEHHNDTRPAVKIRAVVGLLSTPA
jgi:hypothetical protein